MTQRGPEMHGPDSVPFPQAGNVKLEHTPLYLRRWTHTRTPTHTPTPRGTRMPPSHAYTCSNLHTIDQQVNSHTVCVCVQTHNTQTQMGGPGPENITPPPRPPGRPQGLARGTPSPRDHAEALEPSGGGTHAGSRGSADPSPTPTPASPLRVPPRLAASPTGFAGCRRAVISLL